MGGSGVMGGLNGLDVDANRALSLLCTDFNTDCVPINYCMRVCETERKYWMEDRAKALLAHKSLQKGFKVWPASSKNETRWLRSENNNMQYSFFLFDLLPWDCSTVSILENCEIYRLFLLYLFLSVRMSFLLLFTMLVLKWKHLAPSSIHPQRRWRESTRATVQLEHRPLKKQPVGVHVRYIRGRVCASPTSQLDHSQQNFPLQTVSPEVSLPLYLCLKSAFVCEYNT